MAALWVLWKELREMLREPTTLFFAVFFPMILYPAVIAFGGQAQDDRDQHPRVELRGAALLELEDVEVVQAGADAVAEVWPDRVEITWDSTDPASERAKDVLVDGTHALWPIRRADLALSRGRLNRLLARVLPGALAMLVLISAAYPAAEAVTGERERGTLETSLVAPAPRWAMVLGKLGAVFLATALGAGAHTAAVILTLAHLLAVADVTVALPWAGFARAVPAGVLLVTSAAALCLLSAAPTRTFKQAQGVTTMLATLAGGLAMLAALDRVHDAAWAPWVPFLNHALAVGDGMLGLPSPSFVPACGESLLLALGAVAVSARVSLRWE
jgi:ABC-type Na+ efflux pump permease subunit